MRSHTRPPRSRATARPSRGSSSRSERPDARAAVALHAGQPGLSVDVLQEDGRPVVVVAGELDLAGAGLVTAMLDHVRRRSGAAGRRGVVDVDLAGVTFVDTSGLACVEDARTRVVATSEPVRRLQRLLDATGSADGTPDWYAASA